MTAYERKPNRVDAVLFDLSKGAAENNGNWYEVVRLLGPHQTKIEEDDRGKKFFVFDVAEKVWKFLPSKHYVVRDTEGVVWVESKESFEEDFQEVSHSLFPNTYPSPFPGITYGGTVRNG